MHLLLIVVIGIIGLWWFQVKPERSRPLFRGMLALFFIIFVFIGAWAGIVVYELHEHLYGCPGYTSYNCHK